MKLAWNALIHKINVLFVNKTYSFTITFVLQHVLIITIMIIIYKFASPVIKIVKLVMEVYQMNVFHAHQINTYLWNNVWIHALSIVVTTMMKLIGFVKHVIHPAKLVLVIKIMNVILALIIYFMLIINV